MISRNDLKVPSAKIEPETGLGAQVCQKAVQSDTQVIEKYRLPTPSKGAPGRPLLNNVQSPRDFVSQRYWTPTLATLLRFSSANMSNLQVYRSIR